MRIKKFFRFLLCLFPGAAHLYLGLKRQGLQLMTLFFLPLFLSDMIRLSLFMFAVPVIWFYSFFDGLRKVNGQEELIDSDLMIFSWLTDDKFWSRDKHKLLAYGLIGLGLILIFERVLMPMVSMYFNWQVRGIIEMGIISVLLILGGIKLLISNKKEKGEDKIWEDGE